MNFGKKKINNIYLIIFFFIIFLLLLSYLQNLSKKDKEISLRPVSVNLLTSVHLNLSWSFKPIKTKLLIKQFGPKPNCLIKTCRKQIDYLLNNLKTN